MAATKRLAKNFERMRTFSAAGEGITRLAFSDEDWQAREFVMNLMKEAELAVRVDPFGNIIGRREGLDPNAAAIMFGSHIDSVPNGGNFDGVVGVLSAIEVAHRMKENGFRNEHPLEIVVFMAEESSRFGAATLGSKAMRGLMDTAALHKLTDRRGSSLYDVLNSRGLNADAINAARYDRPLKAFLELHIEQGKVLENTQKQIGIVTGIAAPTRLKVVLRGQADHSGATPMAMRHDGLCAAAEIVLQVERLAAAAAEHPVVGTVGILQVHPGVMNVIPGIVELGIDIRSISMASKTRVVQSLSAQIQAIAAARSIPAAITVLTDEQPVQLQPAMLDFLEALCQETDASYLRLPSGAGHDAMHWAEVTHTGMLFIPCKGGISHNPAESADPDDINAAVDLLYRAVCRLSAKDFQWN